ncbi:MAG: hypothetical protein CBD27_06705 [Rhodospirillaceae bacterium TMED167]|nr:glutamine synthetase [Rhodospirillaceae bacterium]OUW27218.1 MAG: hypothetical protein CBD27_06705 [Rhodospirillaceae bacterium TMED167]
MTDTATFIEQHDLWTDDQVRLAAQVQRRVEADGLSLIRLVWADPHGVSRAKTVSVPVFLTTLQDGYNINVATTTLDAAGGRIFASFTEGGGMGLPEMTGSPNLIIVPDPATFRALPWAPGVGWILCDQYFVDGRPFHFAPREILRKQLQRLAETDTALVVGLEIEWYLARLEEDRLVDPNIAEPGMRAAPLETSPMEPGFSYHSETTFDVMQPVISELAEIYEKLNLPLRSFENEWGPGQLECTFSAGDAMKVADDYVLFRTATRQICRRLGFMASFMCRPKLKGHYASGWHLHQSLVHCGTGDNILMPGAGDTLLSGFGRSYLAGLLHHAAPSAIFAVPTINGYRRFRPNSLAPDRATWAHDHRGTMVRVLGGPGDHNSRLENRLGEPAANPYLYFASQVVAGLNGVAQNASPGEGDLAPYAADRPKLPASLEEAHGALNASKLFRAEFGDLFVNYFLALKQSEINRFREQHPDADATATGDVTDWEQNEYFDFF